MKNVKKFLPNQNGTVIDVQTGLMWLRFSIGQKWINGKNSKHPQLFAWSEAVKLKYTHAGYEDWRMPTLKELRSIVDSSKRFPAIDKRVFPNTDGFYWSSTKKNDSRFEEVFLILSDDGTTKCWMTTETNECVVRLVRDLTGDELDKLNFSDVSEDHQNIEDEEEEEEEEEYVSLRFFNEKISELLRRVEGLENSIIQQISLKQTKPPTPKFIDIEAFKLWLSTQDEISLKEFTSYVKALDLLPAVVIDDINEAAYHFIGEPVIVEVENEVLKINRLIFDELLGAR